MATPVVRNDAEALLHKEKHLAVPSVGVERPARMSKPAVGKLARPLRGFSKKCPFSIIDLRGEVDF
jgi:hypothetical protein